MLRFVDGCSHLSQSLLGVKWDVVNSLGTGITYNASSNGRFGGGAITFTGAGGTSFDVPLYIQKNYDGKSTIIFGFAIQQTATQNTFGGQLLEFLDGNTVQVGLAIMPSGQIQAFRSTNASSGVILHPQTGVRTVLGMSTNSILASSYEFIEVKIVHHPTTGSIEIKRNNAAFWTLTNVNTAISGSNNSSAVVVGGYSAFAGSSVTVALKANMTDFHLVDTTVNGSEALDPVDFIGDHHWERILPTADGADTDFITTGSTDHFANIDEVPPNTTDFNSSNVVGDRDGFEVSDPSGPDTATVIVAASMYCQKNAGGSNQLSAFIREPVGPTYKNGTSFEVPSPWAVRQSFIFSKPGSASALTVADIKADQIGYEKMV